MTNGELSLHLKTFTVFNKFSSRNAEHLAPAINSEHDATLPYFTEVITYFVNVPWRDAF